MRGHFEGDPQKYRAEEELALGGGLDPLLRVERLLQDGGLGDAQLQAVIDDIEQRVTAAVEKARVEPQPDFDTALGDVYTVSGKELQHG